MSEIVITAKGSRLNMAELRMRARMPMQPKGDMKDKVAPQRTASPQMRIQGFMPSAAGVPEPPVVVVEAAPVQESMTMADYTGVMIEQPKHLKQKPEDPMATVNDTLSDIMGDLEQYQPSRRRAARKS